MALAVLWLAGHASATSPTFTLDPPSSTLPGIPATAADLLAPALPPAAGPLPPPVVGIPAAALGLLPGDVLSGMSFGTPPLAVVPGLRVHFSVDAATLGVPVVPPPGDVVCEAAGAQAMADVFLSLLSFPPATFFPAFAALDGNGLADSPCGPPALPGLGLAEPGDNLSGLELCPASFVFSGGALTAPVYLTLAPGSPTLVALGATAGAVLAALPPGFLPPVIALPPAAQGLIPGLPGCGAPACDEIDALDVLAGGGDAVFSLAPGSPSLAACGFTAADVILAGLAGGCVSLFPAAALSLGAPPDNIDALAINFDLDSDLVADVCDNCPAVPNNAQTDSDGDGVGNACDPVPLCPATPASGCDVAGKSVLLIKDTGMDGASATDKVVWKWLKGPLTAQADFDNPTLAADYGVCVYDAGGFVTSFELAAAALCGANPCWAAVSDKGYQYKDPVGAADGVGKFLLKGGDAGKSKILLKAKDANVPLSASTLPLDDSASITVQVHNSANSNCWEAIFPPASVIKNDDTLFKAKTP